MLAFLGKKKKPLRFHLLVIFLAGLFITSGLLIAINTVMGRDAALMVAQQHMDTAASSIIERTHRLFREIQTLVRVASTSRNLGQAPGRTSHPAVHMLSDALKHIPEVNGIYVGYEDGSFFQLVDLSTADAWKANTGAPDRARMAIRTILREPATGIRTERWTFLDNDGVAFQTTDGIEAKFDPRIRPWYQGALRTDDIAWASPYLFASSAEMGITVSRMVIGGGAIVGADVTLRELASFMATQKVSANSVAAIFTQNGQIVVHPNIAQFEMDTRALDGGQFKQVTVESANDPIMSALHAKGGELGWPIGKGFRFTAEGVDYMASLQALPSEMGRTTVLAIAAPVAELTEHVDGITRTTLIASLVLLFSTIPLVVWAARSMSESLGKLAQEAENLSNLDVATMPKLESRVTEIQVLAEALQRSHTGLTMFGRYVPKALVRKILQSSQEPSLGGKRQHVTLLFSDIEGFTSISEDTRPEQLVEYLSEYFSGISSIVHAHQGTINKYIGDAVMGMWNAPEELAFHQREACCAALEIKAFVDDFNEKAAIAGMPQFRTRLGIHSGVALVGHVGDHDHLEYTALGDTVNVAARLEGLNKNYQTTILVSEEVVQAIDDVFETRFVDSVAPKGRKNTIGVYELIGMRSDTACVKEDLHSGHMA